jgi:hypothetical protein
MKTRNSPAGRHRAVKERAAVTTSLAVAVMLSCASIAQAAPGEQPGVTAPSGPREQPGVTGTPPRAEAPVEREYLPGYQPSEQVQNAEWRSYEDYQQGYSQPSYNVQPAYVEPSYVQPFHSGYSEPYVEPQPEVVTPPPPPMVQRPGIAPIQAPENKMLLGSALLDRPAFIPEPDARRISNTMSAIQADGANFINSLGVPTNQADRLAAGTVTGVVVGGAAGALALGAPAAVLGAAGGTAIGTVVGIAVGTTLASVFIPGVGIVVGPVLGGVNGALIGAGVGALALGVPAAMAGGALGMLFGGIYGATFAGGQDVVIEEPAPAPAPEVPAPAPVWTPPVVDTQAVTAQTQQVLGQVAHAPAGEQVVEAVRDFTDVAPSYAAAAQSQVDTGVSQVREAALAQPGGPDAVAAVDQAIAEVSTATAPVAAQAAALVAAVNDGLNA